MSFPDRLAALAARCHRRPWTAVVVAAALAALAVFAAAHNLGVVTNTNLMFPESLPWRANQIAAARDFPQFNDLLVAVVDGRAPEAAEATADALKAALAAEPGDFHTVRRPDSSPYLSQEGLLFLDEPALEALLERLIEAQPFLGELAADPSARGLFRALGLLGKGVTAGHADLTPYAPALASFHRALDAALAGREEPLSWSRLLGGGLADMAGKYRFVLAQPKLDFGSLQPGGPPAARMRQIADGLPLVRSGEARVRITGAVALADDEFATVAQGIVGGMVASVLLITLWLFLAVRSWRLIVPILLTLLLGLLLTILFAATAIGTLNLVSVGFGILFVGIAVDFGIQFVVRYREARHELHDAAAALDDTARRAGGQILVASAATAAGFLSFAPTSFRGVAELGLIAGAGMLIAFCCTLFFLPAALRLFNPPGEPAEIGFRWAAPLDDAVRRRRVPILAVFALVAAAGAALTPQIKFDADPLHTKDPHTEALSTLYDLSTSPTTNPFTIDVMVPGVADIAPEAARLAALPSVKQVLSIESFVPLDQGPKLALIGEAARLLRVTLAERPERPPPGPAEIRQAAQDALDQIAPALAALPADHPLVPIAADLKRLAAAPDDVTRIADAALTMFLPMQLAQLRDALAAHPATVQTLPPEIARDWVLPNGRARIQVVPTAAAQDSDELRRFVRQVTAVAPDAGGPAVAFEATAATIIGAFRQAAATAVIAIAVILLVALRRVRDAVLVLAPLLLSGLGTVVAITAIGQPLNYANIIALPLLLGVGVSFNIYFVMNWRRGRTSVLGSATARAVLYSALTTASAFGALALSAHRGTASMGQLLLMSLACTLVSSLVFVPAMLAAIGPPKSGQA